MSTTTKAQAAGGEAEASPLSVVYTGETIKLSVREKPILVKPWGVKALLHEVPAMFGGIMVKMAPLLQTMKEGNVSAATIVPMLMSHAGEEMLTFVAWSLGLTPVELKELSAAEFVMALRAVVRQNLDFFEQLSGLYQDLGRPVSGLLSNSSDAKPGHESKTGARG